MLEDTRLEQMMEESSDAQQRVFELEHLLFCRDEELSATRSALREAEVNTTCDSRALTTVPLLYLIESSTGWLSDVLACFALSALLHAYHNHARCSLVMCGRGPVKL